MKLKVSGFYIPLLLLILFLSFGCNSHQKADYLIRVYEGEYDEIGVKNAYVNLSGDTIVAAGKYLYCYTDTLKTIGMVLKNNGQIAAIDKSGKELFEVFRYDNGPDYVSDGLFRIVDKGKIGYANMDGEIVILPIFDCAYPFKNGKAKVSLNCKKTPENEHQIWESNKWYSIDKTGKKIKSD